jgi:hypothetical protein
MNCKQLTRWKETEISWVLCTERNQAFLALCSRAKSEYKVSILPEKIRGLAGCFFYDGGKLIGNQPFWKDDFSLYQSCTIGFRRSKLSTSKLNTCLSAFKKQESASSRSMIPLAGNPSQCHPFSPL